MRHDRKMQRIQIQQQILASGEFEYNGIMNGL